MADRNNAVIIKPSGQHTSSVIWLHGLGADGHDFESIVPELALPPGNGIRFIFPHAPVRPVTINGGMTMRAWYDVRDMDLRKMEDADAIYASANLVNDFINAEIDDGIATENILLAGFSQGGAMALHTGLRYPEPLAGVLALSAYLPLPDKFRQEAASANDETPVMICHGNFDPVIPVQAGQQSSDILVNAGYKVAWHTYDMPHALCIEEIRDVADWIKQSLLNDRTN